MISGKAKLAGVIGYPVSHSLSPVLHNYWLKTYQIDGVYIPLHVTPDGLSQVLNTLPKMGFQGVNLTLPHKEQALDIVDEVSDIARRIGAVNTITVRDGLLVGTNTDGEGFLENLKQQVKDLSPYLEQIMLIGAGGAAKSIAVALADAGAQQIRITNRSIERAEALANEIEVAEVCAWENKEAALEDVTLLVNTTSLGMVGQPPLELSLDTLPKQALVTDAIYNPLMTPLLLQAKNRGNLVVTGIGMLMHQAVSGFEGWFGVRPEVDETITSVLIQKAGL